jgi:hypothetical protein
VSSALARLLLLGRQLPCAAADSFDLASWVVRGAPHASQVKKFRLVPECARVHCPQLHCSSTISSWQSGDNCFGKS